MNETSAFDATQTASMSSIPTIATPSVCVIGCGGAGINMVRNIATYLTNNNNTKYRFIDTSFANIRSGEEIIVIQGEGSGLVRKQNVEPISQKIASLTADDLNLSDINILVFSLSGGSGSIVGPTLIREIARRGKLVVAVVIASSQSELHTTNTLNTMKTLEVITTNNNIYLPITIFNNNAGVDIVDKCLPYKLERLVDLLTLPAAELDKNDRLHWINVPKTTGTTTGGLRLLHVDSGQKQDELSAQVELWGGFDDYIFDSVISIRSIQSRHRYTPSARVSYEGSFTSVQLVPMLGVIGNQSNAFEKLTTEISDTLQKYKTQSAKKAAAVTVTSSEIDPDSGLVF